MATSIFNQDIIQQRKLSPDLTLSLKQKLERKAEESEKEAKQAREILGLLDSNPDVEKILKYLQS